MRGRRTLVFSSVMTAISMLGGCATLGSSKGRDGVVKVPKEEPGPSVRDLLYPPPHEILKVQETDAKIALLPSDDQALGTAIRSAQVVYLGERHDDPRVHRFEVEMLERVLDISASVGVGFEMLPASAQPALDAYIAGRSTEAEFLLAVDWEKSWGFSFSLYRPLFELCRHRRLPTYALNAEKGLARKVAHGGIDALTDEEKLKLPAMRPDEAQFRHFTETMRALPAHGALTDEAIGRYYQAQLVWDETMAQTLTALRPQPNPPRTIIVIAGEEHARRFAMPSRAQRRGIKSDLVVLPVYPADIAEGIAQAAEGADFLFVLPASDAPPPTGNR